MRWLFALFVVVPLVEFALLLTIGDWLGLGPTIALIIVTGLVGGTLARAEGFKVWQEWQGELAAMRSPGLQTAQGLLVLVGGILLVTPGVLTDLAGFACVIPQTRRRLALLLISRFSPSLAGSGQVGIWTTPRRGKPRDVIDTTGRTVNEKER